MPSYKVKEKGFFGGVLREPGGKHDPVVTSKPLKPVPSWLEEIKSTPAQQRKKTTKPKEKVEDFMGDDGGVETL
jgi:hypothetical protein